MKEKAKLTTAHHITLYWLFQMDSRSSKSPTHDRGRAEDADQAKLALEQFKQNVKTFAILTSLH
jgi:hypothetical protein